MTIVSMDDLVIQVDPRLRSKFKASGLRRFLNASELPVMDGMLYLSMRRWPPQADSFLQKRRGGPCQCDALQMMAPHQRSQASIMIKKHQKTTRSIPTTPKGEKAEMCQLDLPLLTIFGYWLLFTLLGKLP